MASKLPEPPSLLSDDQSQPTSVISNNIFFVARYDGRAVAIRKSTDFKATIASVQAAFPHLGTLESTQVHLSSRINGFGEEMIEINGELWADLCHHLLNVRVDVSVASDVQTIRPSTRYLSSTGSPHASTVKLERIVVRVKDTYGQMDLNLPVFVGSTVRGLKDLIIAHDRRLPKHITLQHKEHNILVDNEQLHAYGVKNYSDLTVATEFQVDLIGSDLQRSPATISIFNTQTALRLIALDRYGIDVSQQVLSCDGEVIGDGKKLGECHQLVPGCQVYVNKASDATRTNSQEAPMSLTIRKDTGFGDPYSCTVSSRFVILDIKALVSNKFNIPVSGQELYNQQGQLLSDDLSLYHAFNGSTSGGEIRVKGRANTG